MRRRRVIASAMLCLLLAGTTLAAADRDHGRGGRDKDRESKSEEKSNERQSRRQHSVQRSDGREGRVSGRDVVQTRREPWRDGRSSGREVVQTRREPSRDGRSGRDVVQARPEPGRIVGERWTQQRPAADARFVSRTPTPRDWRTHALRGEAQYTTWDRHRARRWQYEHRTWRARGGYHGYRIPDYRYRVVFGPRHRFRVDSCPLVIVSGYPRFYYGGYWVTFIDPWPEYWEDDWFVEDDCYVVHDYDGYYLTNVRYPSVRIAVSFTLG